MRSKRFVKRQSNYGIGTFQEEPLNVAEEAKQRQHERIIGVGTGTVDLNSKTYRTAEKNMLVNLLCLYIFIFQAFLNFISFFNNC